MKPGLTAAIGAYLIWGLFPIYRKALDAVPALQIMAHRLCWCFLMVAAYLTLKRGWAWWKPLVAQPRLVRLLCISAVLIASNWWLYIWAVNSGHIVETSLGYFINPLFNVLLGVAVLGERLNPRQWLAVAIAAAGVLYLTLQVGRLPWIALALAASFGTYGLIRKVAVVESIPALGFESSVLFLPALAYLIFLEGTGSGSFGHTSLADDALLVGSGIVTAVPLILYAMGAKLLRLTTIAIMQYSAPTMIFLIAVFVFKEPFSLYKLSAFVLIWTALAIYTWSLVKAHRAT